MTSFWSGWIIILTTACLVLTTWLLFAHRSKKQDNTDQTTGHSYDGIVEYDNPLPAWWFYMFVGTIIFSIIYLAAYPGMGSYKGFLNWTATGQYESEVQKAKETYGPIFAKFASMPIEEVAKDPQALKMGQRIFANNCAVCHGSDASGGQGYPNLTDADWLYGGNPETIKMSITSGRTGMMPAKGVKPDMTDQEVNDVVQYVLTLSGRGKDEEASKRGQALFQVACMACHGPEGKGNQMLGAPNLTDNVWLYGGSPLRIKESIIKGRMGKMPAHQELLSSDKIHILSAYIYSLSHK